MPRVPLIVIAKIAHAANREWCRANDLPVRETWDNLDAERQAIVVKGVQAIADGRAPTPEASHENWCNDMVLAGWKYAPVRDEAQKHHECLVPYGELPVADRVKDSLFRAIVTTLLEVGQ
jgi:hypothetical protein